MQSRWLDDRSTLFHVQVKEVAYLYRITGTAFQESDPVRLDPIGRCVPRVAQAPGEVLVFRVHNEMDATLKFADDAAT